MIAIINITEGGIKKGINQYRIQINDRIIAKFEHDRSKGLEQCLLDAAKAVENQNILDIVTLYEMWEKTR